MGLIKIENCIFTGIEVISIINGKGSDIEYQIHLNGRKHLIKLPQEAKYWSTDNDFFKSKKNILRSLLLNHNWLEDENAEIKIESLRLLIKTADFPHTPNEKLNFIFLKLFSLQAEDGQKIELKRGMYPYLWKSLYLNSIEELNYYAHHLHDSGLIKASFGNINSNRPKQMVNYNITFKGLNKAIELQEAGKNSNLCFIAMSFKPETTPIRNAIKSAIIKTGFRPIIMDEENIESDKTINDAIIVNLKKCNFCISDFSYHSNGVYFESGFALGQGKKVIYTCSKIEFKNAHFDIKPLQHIIYETPDQLERELIDKIEAWIK